MVRGYERLVRSLLHDYGLTKDDVRDYGFMIDTKPDEIDFNVRIKLKEKKLVDVD